MTKHEFVRFFDLRGNQSIGFTCANNGTQVMPDIDTTRVIEAECYCCGHSVRFDTGWLGWRSWFLPRRAFATPQCRRLLTLDGWDGTTTFTAMTE